LSALTGLRFLAALHVLAFHFKDSFLSRDTPALSVAAGTVIELGIDLAVIGVGSAAPLSFFVTVCDASGTETERHPAHRPIETTVPDASFASRNWTA